MEQWEGGCGSSNDHARLLRIARITTYRHKLNACRRCAIGLTSALAMILLTAYNHFGTTQVTPMLIGIWLLTMIIAFGYGVLAVQYPVHPKD